MVTSVTTVTNVTKSSYYNLFMTHFKQPYLQPYKGKSTRFNCPGCEKKQCFTLYLDGNTHEPINSTVGKCNRIIKCGYHKTPKQYFQENPSKIKMCATANKILVNAIHYSRSKTNMKNNKLEETFGTIPFSFVEKSASYKSNFVRFLCEFMTEEQIRSIGENYALGASKNNEVIFWQIDTKGKVRTAKIMQYNPETGKRVKHQSGAINWVHNKLKQTKELPEDFNLKQCFFGEHLLKIYPEKTVAIVESEKTACIASVAIPELNWLSSGSVQGISAEKCKVLKDKNVILFPDLKAYDLWSDKAVEIQKQCKCHIKVSNLLEDLASDEEKENGLDIADYLIDNLKNKNTIVQPLEPLPPPQNHYSKLLNSFIAQNPAVQLLIDKLSLEELI